MKRMLYFDCSAGVSGDMFVGALLDAGASFDVVRETVACLGVPGIELRARPVVNRGISATKFDVLDPDSGRPVDEVAEPAHAHVARHDHDHGHGHDHHHDRGRERPHDHHHDDGHCRGHGHGSHGPNGRRAHEHRGLEEIRQILAVGGLPRPVRDDALAVFELLAAAESRVHGVAPERVHFHEVGALDAIADVVAAAAAFHDLGADEAWASAVHVGAGTVRCAHGVVPVPAPATLELLKGAPVYSDGTLGELATPTGVALLRRFCNGFGAMPPMVVQAVGYGAGTKDFGIPNVLRVTLGIVAEEAAPLQAAACG